MLLSGVIPDPQQIDFLFRYLPSLFDGSTAAYFWSNVYTITHV